MTTWRRRLRRVLIAGLALIGVLAVAALVLLRTHRVDEWLRRAAVTRLNGIIDGDVEIGQLSGSLLHDVSIRDVRIRQGADVVIEAALVEAHYDPVQLLRGQLHFTSVRLVAPRVHVVQGEDGWNLAHLGRPRTGGATVAPLSVVLDDVQLEDGRISLDLRHRPHVDLDRIDAALGVRITGSGVDLALSRMSLRDATAGDVVSLLTGHVIVDAGGVALRDLAMQAGGVDVRANGRIANGVVSGLDVRADLREWRGAPLRSIVPGLARVPSMSGRISASGASAALSADWTLTIGGQCASSGRAHVDVTHMPMPIRADVTAKNCDPGALLQRVDLRGRINGRSSVDGAVDVGDPVRSRAQFTFHGDDVSLFGYAADALSASGRVDDGAVRAAGDVRAYGAGATFDARLTRPATSGALPLTVRGTVSHLNAARLPMVPAGTIATDVSGDYIVSSNDGVWRTQLTASAATAGPVSIGPGTLVRADITGKRLDLSVAGPLRGTLDDRVGLRSGGPVSLDGRVDAHATIPDVDHARDLVAPMGEVHASLAGKIGAGNLPATADIDATFEGGGVNVQTLSIVGAGATLTAQGRLAIAEAAREPSHLTYDVAAGDLSAWSAFGLAGLRGSLHVAGRATGPADRLQVGGDVSAQELAYADRATALAVNGTLSAVVPVQAWTRASGTIDLTGTFLRAAGQEIPRAAFTASYADQRIQVTGEIDQAARTLRFDSAVTMKPDAQALELRALTLSGQGAPWQLPDGKVAVVRYGSGGVRVDGLVLTRGQERLGVQGTIAVDATAARPSDLAVDVSAVNVGDLFLLATGDRRAEGTADGHLQMTGTLRDLSGQADLQIRDATVAGVVIPSARATARVARRVATVDAHLVERSGAAFDVTGHLPLDPSAGGADLRVSSTAVSLGILEAATTAISDVKGTAGVDLHLSGPLANLDVDGSIRLTDAAFRVAASGVAYTNVNAEIRCQNGYATIERASLSDSDGHTATVTGRAGLRAVNGSRAVEATLQTNGIHVLNNDLGEIEVSANVDVAGPIGAPRVTGTVRATKARVEVDQLLKALGSAAPPPPVPPPPSSDAARALFPPEPPAPTPTAAAGANEAAPAAVPSSGPWGAASIAVDVQMPDDVVLRGRNVQVGTAGMGLGNLNLTVGGNLTVRKRPGADPVVVGAVEAVRGFYEFQGRRFEVTRGSAVQFRGARPINPSLDVTGEREVSGITARVRVTGTVRRPVLGLSSQPPLDEGDVLALIVFNQSLNQLGESQQVDVMRRASDMALGAVASSLTQSIGHALDVDLFDVRAPTADQAGEVNVGTQVGDRVFVGFRQQFGSTGASRLSIEYRITEALRLLTSFGQGADPSASAQDREAAGVDLVYTIRY